ncbi:VIER F-box protein 2 [Tanacetum coccineum]
MTNSIPTRFNISRRGIDIESLACVNCDVGIESTNHLFFACDMAKKISKLIARWWDVPFMDFDSYSEWRSWIDNVKMPKKNKNMFEDYYSEGPITPISAGDMAYPCCNSPKTTKELKLNTPYPEKSICRIEDIITILKTNTLYPSRKIRLRMTKVIKGEFEKIKDVKVEDVSLTCDTSLEVFNNEVNRLSEMDNDLFEYEVEVANIPCDSKMDDDSEHEADDDMGYDPSDIAFTEWLGSKFFNYKTMDHYTMKALWIYWIRGDDEVELTDEESSDDKDEVAKIFRIDTNLFNFETPMCKAFKEFNYLLQIDPCLLTKDIEGFKTYKDYKDDWIYEWNKDVPWVDENWKDDGYCNGGNLPGTYIIENQLHYQDYEWYEALEDSELKDEALRNKAIMEGFIEDNDESHNEREELCEVHELPMCNIRRYMMIKYSFSNDEEYVAVKEDEYDDLTITREEACRAYKEIFRIIDKGWMVTRAE